MKLIKVLSESLKKFCFFKPKNDGGNKITLRNLCEKTEQEVFDYVCEHLVRQGKPSWSSKYGVCLYLDDEGNKCAAGCLISDDEYKTDYEGQNWVTLIGNFKETTSCHVHLISRLQQAHDSSTMDLRSNRYNGGGIRMDFINILKPKLLGVANEFGLIYKY